MLLLQLLIVWCVYATHNVLTDINVATVFVEKVFRSIIILIHFKQKRHVFAFGLETAHQSCVIHACNELPLRALCSVNTCSWSCDRKTYHNVLVALEECQDVSLLRTQPLDFAPRTVKGYSGFTKLLPFL